MSQSLGTLFLPAVIPHSGLAGRLEGSMGSEVDLVRHRVIFLFLLAEDDFEDEVSVDILLALSLLVFVAWWQFPPGNGDDGDCGEDVGVVDDESEDAVVDDESDDDEVEGDSVVGEL